MAHKKGAGSTNNGRDSVSKRLGVKIFGGQFAISGNIIVRQRGTRFHPGEGVGLGKDHTIYAVTDGTVVFTKKRNNRTYISIAPAGVDMEELKAPVAKKEAPKKETPKVEEVVAAAPAPEAEEAPKKKEAKGDDLKKIEGIGPKIAETLADAGIATYAELAKATPEQIAEIIADVRGSHVTDTWPAQAKLAAEGKWDELKEWQDQLDGGVEVAADDLTKIEGIGPKIAETLTAAGIATYAKLAGTEAEKIAEIIADVRGNHVTDTWPAQAKLAAEGKWDELQKWQDELDGGKE